MDNSIYNTNWIWTPEWEMEKDKSPQFVYFRKEVLFQTVPSKCVIQISADSRYKLYVNGSFLQAGPGKGDLQTWYYDKADLASFLCTGKNVVSIEVLRYPADINMRNHSLLRTEVPCLYVADEQIETEAGESVSFQGRSGWKCRLTEHIQLMAEPAKPAPLHILENAYGDITLHGWMLPGFDDHEWSSAKPYTFFSMNQTVSPWNLKERAIPYLELIMRRFREAVTASDEKQNWKCFLAGKDSMAIPPNTKQTVEISAGELMTGYLNLAFKGGEGAKVTILCAECYAYPPDGRTAANLPVKGDRTDSKNGKLYGYQDIYRVGGYGTAEMPEIYEPFWFRTFRFIKLTVETATKALELLDFSYRQTGYPLEVKTQVTTSDPTLEAIWDISERTLRRCMHETYMDCPFYEQLQYAMDSRTEILYTYMIAADDRLARKCMEDFRRSQRYDGMITHSAPNAKPSVIPGFSIYYLLMVHDHMMYFGDKELVTTHLPAIERILHFFESHLAENNIVQKIGGPIMRQPYWSFIDWTPQWDSTSGVPKATLKGPITMESLLYVLGLQKAAELEDYVEHHCVAQEYRHRAAKVQLAIKKYCMGEITSNDQKISLLQDGPGIEEYCVHCQVFAILTGTVSPEEGRRMLQETIGNPAYPQCSVAMGFYLFRALETAGWYEKSDDIWNIWRDMVKNYLTTCVENDTDARSDCHAWGAAALYELPAVILGVQPAAPGFSKIKIMPQMGYLTEASGKVITSKGEVIVHWKKTENGTCKLLYEVPEGISVVSLKQEMYNTIANKHL